MASIKQLRTQLALLYEVIRNISILLLLFSAFFFPRRHRVGGRFMSRMD